jgi:hypothetical protein
MLLIDFSYWKSGDLVYFNIPNKPWQYFTALTETLSQKYFSSSVADESKPSDIRYLDDQNNKVKYPVKLEIPSLPSKLSSPVSGNVIYSTFTVNLINNDGFFDDIQQTKYTNTPIRIKRADVKIPKLDDFKTIRQGLIEYVKVTDKNFSVVGADYIRTLEQSATDTFTLVEFPNLPESSIDKNIPIGWGLLRDVPLIEVGTDQYIAIDQNYLTSVQAVYDKDGNYISFNVSGGIIAAIEGSTADITGRTNNKIGEIIIDITSSKGNIAYVEGVWDKSETDNYINTSADIGFYYSSGTVRNCITEALKSDSAFFMTKTDGRLTIRKWDNGYNNWLVDSWRIMKIPNKNNQEATKYYNSSVAVKYAKQEKGNNYLFELQDKSRESELVKRYKKSKIQTYKTRLLSERDSRTLSKLILDRFGEQSESLTVALGESIIDLNLLDKITLEMKINEREFSVFSNWVIISINPAQDVLGLASIGGATKNQYLGTSEDNVILTTSTGAWLIGNQGA